MEKGVRCGSPLAREMVKWSRNGQFYSSVSFITQMGKSYGRERALPLLRRNGGENVAGKRNVSPFPPGKRNVSLFPANETLRFSPRTKRRSAARAVPGCPLPASIMH